MANNIKFSGGFLINWQIISGIVDSTRFQQIIITVEENTLLDLLKDCLRSSGSLVVLCLHTHHVEVWVSNISLRHQRSIARQVHANSQAHHLAYPSEDQLAYCPRTPPVNCASSQHIVVARLQSSRNLHFCHSHQHAVHASFPVISFHAAVSASKRRPAATRAQSMPAK